MARSISSGRASSSSPCRFRRCRNSTVSASGTPLSNKTWPASSRAARHRRFDAHDHGDVATPHPPPGQQAPPASSFAVTNSAGVAYRPCHSMCRPAALGNHGRAERSGADMAVGINLPEALSGGTIAFYLHPGAAGRDYRLYAGDQPQPLGSRARSPTWLAVAASGHRPVRWRAPALPPGACWR